MPINQHAIRLFASSLRVAFSDQHDLQARSLNQQAVWLACCDLGNVPHGASHGIGYILGSLCGVPHGYTSCVMLPAVLEWNRGWLRDEQAIIDAFGGIASSAAACVSALVDKLGLPKTLADVGVAKEQLPEIASRAIKHPVVRRNPRPVQNEQQLLEILQLAWDGISPH